MWGHSVLMVHSGRLDLPHPFHQYPPFHLPVLMGRLDHLAHSGQPHPCHPSPRFPRFPRPVLMDHSAHSDLRRRYHLCRRYLPFHLPGHSDLMGRSGHLPQYHP